MYFANPRTLLKKSVVSPAVTLIIFVSTLSSCGETSNGYLLEENFDHNTIGWVEEKTDFHHTEFVDGKLVLISMDTADLVSSNGPANRSFLWNLPYNFEFTTSAEVFDGTSDSDFGFMFYSASLKYKFALTRSGYVFVSEYDYNTDEQDVLIERELENFNLGYNEPFTLGLRVRFSEFEFYVNDEPVGKGHFKAKSWEAVRLYTSSRRTGLKFDYYRFKSL